MKKTLVLLSIASMLAMAAPAFADTSSTLAQIQSLLSQLHTLQMQQQALQTQMQTVNTQQQQTVASLVSTFGQGSSGDKVKVLQALLAADPNIYPEGLITGYYGKLTSQAVKKFQAKSGLSQVGNVGPQTLKKLNDLLKENPIGTESNDGNNGNRLCAIVPPGHLIAPGWLKKEGGVAPVVPACQTLPPGILEKLGTSTSTPDVTAPVISLITAVPSTSTASVSWTTNETATSQVTFGTSTALGSTTSFNGTLAVSHAQMLTGLTPNTIYFYVVWSRDASGNTASSSQGNFATPALDVTAPVISAVTSAVGTTTATVSWTTNEAATSQVFYGTTTAMVFGAALNTSLVTNHSAMLTGLSATTTYFYMVQSTDASANTATSSQRSFVTQSL